MEFPVKCPECNHTFDGCPDDMRHQLYSARPKPKRFKHKCPGCSKLIVINAPHDSFYKKTTSSWEKAGNYVLPTSED